MVSERRWSLVGLAAILLVAGPLAAQRQLVSLQQPIVGGVDIAGQIGL